MAQPKIEVNQITAAPAFDGSAITSVDAITLNNENSADFHAAANLTGTLADARVSQSNVTQHQGAITISASQAGLGNVNNTSDLSKPISTATQTALNGKVAPTNYATSTVGGTVKARVSGTTAYFTINGSNA